MYLLSGTAEGFCFALKAQLFDRVDLRLATPVRMVGIEWGYRNRKQRIVTIVNRVYFITGINTLYFLHINRCIINLMSWHPKVFCVCAQLYLVSTFFYKNYVELFSLKHELQNWSKVTN